MKIYRIGADVSSGYVYASGYGPLPGGMPFLKSVFQEDMNAYWKVNPQKPGLHIDPGRKKTWPDFLSNGNSPPMFFVSDRVVNSLKMNDIDPARLTEMPVAEIRGRGHKKIPPPKYFAMEVNSGIEVAYEESGFKVDSEGKMIFPATDRPRGSKLIFKLDTWDGSDLFSYTLHESSPPPHDILLCTERIVQLANTEGWTNVKFTEVLTK